MKTKQIALLVAGVPALLLGAWLLAATSFDPNTQPVGYVAAPAITSFDISSGNEHVFRTDYDRSDWSGNLLSVPVDATGQANNAVAQWEAADQLARQDFNTGRRIFTRNGSQGVAFRWADTPTATTMTAAQQASIGDATQGPKILNYVRGDNSNEDPAGSKFPARRSKLGAIIHSTPRYVDDGTDKVVYVGANDGMMHAFDADTGDELWAYVPSTVIGNLKKLAVNPYVFQHFVDASPASASVTVSGSPRRILVGGLGAGGKGLFALNITDQTPSDEGTAAAMSMWEISSSTTGFANLGYTYGLPNIVKVNSGGDAIIIGNGYMNSGNGKASLFVIDAATGALIREITGMVGDAGTVAVPNGLSGVRLVDNNADGKADAGYAGDLDGNLWKFDLSSSSPGSWTGTRLFTTSPAQAITVKPSTMQHPYGGRMVIFGTGRMLTSADKTDTSTFYTYGIWDGAPSANNALLAQAMTEATYQDDVVNPTISSRVRWVTGNVPVWTSGAGNHYGWKVPFPVAGERLLGDEAFVEGGRYVIATNNPTISHTPPPDGDGWLIQLDALSGGAPADVFFNLNFDNAVTDADRLRNASNQLDMTFRGIPVAKYLRKGLTSQPILVQQAVLDDTLLTFNPDAVFPPPTDERGISGGHFDPDIYYGPENTKKAAGQVPGQKVHHHEYDDIYDVTGVNMLAASDSKLNISNAITSTSTQFKVLVYNQYWSPATLITVGGAGYVNVRAYAGLATSTSLSVAGLPTYSRADIGSLAVKWPLDAFATKDWWSDGNQRAGLVPTQTGCVNKAPNPGPNGEPHNGALTVQLISASTPESAVRLNVAGRPELGWRVRDADRAAYVLAEWTYFWHHPNGKCMRDAGWTDEPPQDPDQSPGPFTPRDPGSSDPRDGDFAVGGTVVSTTTTTTGNTTTTTTTYSDGTVKEVTQTDNQDGTYTVTTVVRGPDGTVISSETATYAKPGSSTGEGGEQKKGNEGRISWRDF